MRLASALKYDMKLQIRHGFYLAYLIVSSAYIALLYSLPDSWREPAAIFVTFSDPSVLGFYFIGGIVLLEKGQGIYDSLFVTPYRTHEYLLSKILSLSLLSLLSTLAIHLSVFGSDTQLPGFIIGTVLTSLFFTLIGLGVAVRSKSLNGFFMRSTIYTVVFTIPLAELFGWKIHPLFGLLPTKGTLLLLSSAFHPLQAVQFVYATTVLAIWTGLAWVWTMSSFERFVIRKIGEGGEGR
ncbi:ABC transporter permease [Paenibacillus tarimensis]